MDSGSGREPDVRRPCASRRRGARHGPSGGERKVQHVAKRGHRRASSPRFVAALRGLLPRTRRRRKRKLPLQRELLMTAERIRNEGHGNEYPSAFHGSLSPGRAHHAGCCNPSAAHRAVIRPALGADLRSFGTGWLCVCSVLIGALGAITSAAERSTVQPNRIPTQLGSWLAVSRVPIGAIAGLTTWLSAEATMTVDSRAATLLLLAFASGFAERLIVQGPTAGSGNQRTSGSP